MIPAPREGTQRSYLVVVFGPTALWVVQVPESGEGLKVGERMRHSNKDDILEEGRARGLDKPTTLHLAAQQYLSDRGVNPDWLDVTIEVSHDDSFAAMLAVWQAAFQLAHGHSPTVEVDVVHLAGPEVA